MQKKSFKSNISTDYSFTAHSFATLAHNGLIQPELLKGDLSFYLIIHILNYLNQASTIHYKQCTQIFG